MYSEVELALALAVQPYSSIIEFDNYIGELCDYGNSIESLNESQKLFYLNQNLEREVNNGGFYQLGRDYDYVHKCKVADIYVRLLCEKFPESVTVKDVAEYAQVSWGYAKKCITEIDETGDVVDPEEIKQQRLLSSDPHYKITKMDEAFY